MEQIKLSHYEILIAGNWEAVRGTTLGMNPGWLHWTDGESTGIASPGKWRKRAKEQRNDD